MPKWVAQSLLQAKCLYCKSAFTINMHLSSYRNKITKLSIINCKYNYTDR